MMFCGTLRLRGTLFQKHRPKLLPCVSIKTTITSTRHTTYVKRNVRVTTVAIEKQ